MYTPPRKYNLKNIKTIMLNLVYEDSQNPDFVQRDSVKIDPATEPGPWEWKVQVISPYKGKVTYSGRVVFTDGSLGTIPSTEAIKAGSGVTDFALQLPKYEGGQDAFTIQVIPSNVDWTKWAEVKVELQYGTQPTKKITFKDGSDSEEWTITPEDGTQFKWKADYIIKKPFKVEKINWTTADANDSEYLPLPASPSSTVPAL
jgi:hypothetical protein